MSAKVEASIRRAHEHLLEEFTAVEEEVVDLLAEACKLSKWAFEDRTKGLDSYAMKLMTGRCTKYLVDDFYACTIVVPNLKAVTQAIELVKARFRIVDEKPGQETTAWPTNFGFDSVRLTCKLPESVNPKPYHDLEFEVQVKTLLEHAWSKATHDFSYKGDDISWAKERLAAQIKAVLDNVDLSINEMENTASSQFLNKRNPFYEELKLLITLLKEQFEAEDCSHTVSDYKRLAEQVQRVLLRTDTSIDDLRLHMTNEAAEGRGRHTTNLSAYSIVLISLIKQQPGKIKSALEKRRTFPNKGSIVIPFEVIEQWDIDHSSFRSVSILRKDH
jgi:ppGpp synthetase/RelA/SpoT-type nucleotidyltranferase